MIEKKIIISNTFIRHCRMIKNKITFTNSIEKKSEHCFFSVDKILYYTK